MWYSNNNLKLMCDEILRRCESNKKDCYKRHFILVLSQLNCTEKALLAHYFCSLAWNVGSARVLNTLQSQRILTATEYILSQQDGEHIQLVLNDFLETEFDLLANLFVNANYDLVNGIRLTQYLDDCIQRLFKDVEEDPKLNDFSYLTAVKSLVPGDIAIQLMLKHITTALDLLQNSVKEAYRNFIPWINEGVDIAKFTKDIYEKIIFGYEKEALFHLFKLSSSDYFKEWKYYLILIQTISSRAAPEISSEISKYLRNRFRQIASVPCKESMLHLILSARALSAKTADIVKNIILYSQWYKQNVADMNFILSTMEFKNIIALLEECIPYETDEEYLQVHISTAISPPVMCSKLVQGYKNKCKARLAEIKGNLKPLGPDENIILIDSD